MSQTQNFFKLVNFQGLQRNNIGSPKSHPRMPMFLKSFWLFFLLFSASDVQPGLPLHRLCALANNCNVFDVNVSKHTLKKTFKVWLVLWGMG